MNSLSRRSLSGMSISAGGFLQPGSKGRLRMDGRGDVIYHSMTPIALTEAFRKSPVKDSLVNWLPWSVLKISGLA